jgi:hypothetical protein
MSLPAWATCPVNAAKKPTFIGPFFAAKDEMGIATMPINNNPKTQNNNTFFMTFPPFFPYLKVILDMLKKLLFITSFHYMVSFTP